MDNVLSADAGAAVRDGDVRDEGQTQNRTLDRPTASQPEVRLKDEGWLSRFFGAWIDPLHGLDGTVGDSVVRLREDLNMVMGFMFCFFGLILLLALFRR